MKKEIRNDLILIISLVLVIAVALVVVLTRRTPATHAHVMVKDVEVEVIDLSTKEDRDYYIEGTNGILHIHTHDGAICVLESNCPHQDCVKMGYVSDSNHPIICAYNAVTILVDANSNYDVELN